MTEKRAKRTRPRSRLVMHDIHVEPCEQRDGPEKLSVYVDCERSKARVGLDDCRACERLSRIDSHEAGLVVLCRSEDETFETDD